MIAFYVGKHTAKRILCVVSEINSTNWKSGKNMGISRKGAIQQRLHMRNVRLLP